MKLRLAQARPLGPEARKDGKVEGPLVRLEGRCSDCRHLSVMPASGMHRDATYVLPTYYCTHPSLPGGRLLDGAYTPRWCPLWNVGVERLMKRERRAGRSKSGGAS